MTTLTQLERTFSISDNFVSMVADSSGDTTGAGDTGTVDTGTDTTGTGTTGTGTTGTGTTGTDTTGTGTTGTGTTGTGTTGTGTTGTGATGTPTSTTTSNPLVTELRITGIGQVGKKLSSNALQLYDKDGIGSLTYQWQLQGVDIPKATAATYTIAKADYGKSIKLKVTYVNRFSAKIVKESNFIVALLFTDPPTDTSTLTNVLKITGVGEIGKTLTADITQLYDTNGMGPLSYQWQSQGIDIPKATAKTYKLTKAEYGKTIKLKVSYTNSKAIAIVKESNLINVMNGNFINDKVEFKLSWQTLFVPKTITPKNITSSEKLDALLLLYTSDGTCVKQVKSADSGFSITKNTTLDKVGPLQEYSTVDTDMNVTSNIITYQLDFTRLDAKYTKVVYCIYEIVTPINITIASTDLYPRASWATSADLSKKITVNGTVSPFKTIFNGKGMFVLDIHTVGTTANPQVILKFGEEKRLHTATADSKERLCVFGVFTRSPDNNGWFFEPQCKIKTQVKGVVPLDYFKPPLSKFTDLGL
jgi:hypothetical protein